MLKDAFDFLLGPCVRRIPHAERNVFLTFDDGPDPETTPAVLDLLDKYDARATFFVVASRAKAERALLFDAIARGHAIGNHSHDHRYEAFFASDDKLRDWIARAQATLAELTGQEPFAFRSPAGVRTPPLARQLRVLRLPLVHWSVRFFDTVRPWTPERATASWRTTPAGSIVLLHDAQKEPRRGCFLAALDAYLAEGAHRGLRYEALSPALVKSALDTKTLPSPR